MAVDAQYASVVTVSPLTVLPRGSATSVPAKQLTSVTGLSVGDTVIYVMLDTVSTVASDNRTKSSGTLVVLGELA